MVYEPLCEAIEDYIMNGENGNDKILCIITARGGSKRIPRKNIREFCGKPIIAYSIEAALKSKIFDEVMVSTDDEEIAYVSKKYGAKIPFLRSKTNSNDRATTDDVLLEVLDKYEKSGNGFSCMCCLYPTAPFVTPEKLRKAYDVFVENNAAVVMPVVAFSFPPQRAMIRERNSDCLEYVFPDKYESRSQDLDKWYHDAGQFYFYDAYTFIKKKGRIIDGIFPIIMNETEVQDIDNEDDWAVAEIKYKMMNNRVKRDNI